jgi:inosine-uridine nucleoside N-ribohydrolase
LRHVIIDTDPGVDDALALILALESPELKLEAVTTVVGNVDLETANRNTLKILEYMKAEGVPLGSGAAKPLIREARDATSIHGKTGLGEAVLPEPTLRLDKRSATQLILEKADELDGDLMLVSIGPLTNIALAVLIDPEIIKKVAGLVIMGGAFGLTPYGYGNVSPVAEYNIWHDPEAAKIVFDSDIPITAVGLDVTSNPANRLTFDVLNDIEAMNTSRSTLVADLSRNIIRKLQGLSLHDPLAIGVSIDSSLVEIKSFNVEVETKSELTRGMTVVNRVRHQGIEAVNENVDVCISVDNERFLELFMERVVRGDG